MTTIVIKPKTKSEKDFITRLLKKLNIEIDLIEEPGINYETRKAIDDVNLKKGVKTKDSKELFKQLGI